MPNTTPNLGLIKPLVTEQYDIAKVTNENADILDAEIQAVKDDVLDKQDTLVSGTNIKTINSESVLGSGDLTFGLPSGAIQLFAMNIAPTGWLKANGQAVSRVTYANLFSAIGTTFGVGDGSTTFNLPDLRGEFIRGFDDGRGVDSGRVFGSSQTDLLKAHNHTINVYSSGTAQFVVNNTGSNSSQTEAVTNSTGGTETRPRNIAMLYCIKI